MNQCGNSADGEKWPDSGFVSARAVRYEEGSRMTPRFMALATKE